MKEPSAIRKCRSGLTDRFPAIRNGALAYGRSFQKNREVLEIGYLFQRPHWHKGYAIEAAKACKRYAFEALGAGEVCSIIRDTNTASQNVAVRNGMTITDSWTKHYRGVDMPHDQYTVTRRPQIIGSKQNANSFSQ